MDSACEAAANALLDQRLFLVDDEAWQNQQANTARTFVVCVENRVVGFYSILVHAKDEKARTFYQQFDFEPSPIDPLQLMLLLKDAKKTVADIKG